MTSGHHHHEHDHDHDRGEGHGRAGGWRHRTHRLRHLFAPHSHDPGEKVDAAMESTRDGIRAVWVSLLGLGVTALLELLVYLRSGSVALLGDTLHNFADALTGLPNFVAFLVGRRAATRRYTYGYGRAEDLAGIAIVLVIAASAVAAGYGAVRRLMHPATVGDLWVVAAAGLIGFAGNELVARYRIRTDRRIGSAAWWPTGCMPVRTASPPWPLC